jgi:hypothetical protein
MLLYATQAIYYLDNGTGSAHANSPVGKVQKHLNQHSTIVNRVNTIGQLASMQVDQSTAHQIMYKFLL